MKLTPYEIEGIRQVLQGTSIIDSIGFFFVSEAEIRSFLKVNGFDLNSPTDRNRIYVLYKRANRYMKEELGLDVPDIVRDPSEIELLFYNLNLNNRNKNNNKMRQNACMSLKIMNVLNHVDAGKLKMKIPLSDKEMFALIEDRIIEAVDLLSQDKQIGLVSFVGGKKKEYSMVTKLLCKKETLAAQIFDKLRYRLVVESIENIPFVLRGLFHTLIPYNYVVPNQTRNNLVDVLECLLPFVMQLPDDIAKRIKFAIKKGKKEYAPPFVNEFSGQTYRIINFICELPLIVTKSMCLLDETLLDKYGRIIYVQVEFQLVDVKTDLQNNSGENSHERYKNRQKEKVLKRLYCD